MFEKLLSWDRDLLFEAPVWISLLGAMSDGKFDQKEREALAKLTHTRTYSAPKGLQAYYSEAEKRLDASMDKVLGQLPEGSEKWPALVRGKVNKIVGALEKKFNIHLRAQ